MPDVLGTAIVPKQYARTLAFSLNGVERDREFVLDFVRRSAEAKEEDIPLVDELIDNQMVRTSSPYYTRAQFYKGYAPASSKRTRSSLKDTESHQISEALGAQLIGFVMAGREYVGVSPVGGDDYEKSRGISRLLMAMLEQPDWFIQQHIGIKVALAIGVCPMEMFWRTATRSQLVQMDRVDEQGKVIRKELHAMEVPYKDGPVLRVVDWYDFYNDPTGYSIQDDMVGVAKRGRITAMQALEMGRAGAYNAEMVRQAIGSVKQGDQGEEAGGRVNPLRRHSRNWRLPDTFQEMTFFEYWGKVPYKCADGHNNRVITLLQNKVVRSHINPFIDGNIPFKEIIVNPVQGRWRGLSPLEVVRFLQDSTDSLLRNFTDASDMAAHIPLLVSYAFNGNIKQLRERAPLDVIQCSQPDAVAPVPFDVSALAFAAQEYLKRKMVMREASGATNVQQAISGGDRDTATEVSLMARMASQRSELMAQVVERFFYPWVGHTALSRLKQFAPESGIQAFFDGEELNFSLDDIQGVSDVRFSGSRYAMSKLQFAAGVREAMNILGAFPSIVMQYPELVKLLFRDVLAIPNAEQLVKKGQVEVQAQMLQAAAAAQTETAGGTGGGTAALGDDAQFGTEAGETEREGEAVA